MPKIETRNLYYDREENKPLLWFDFNGTQVFIIVIHAIIWFCTLFLKIWFFWKVVIILLIILKVFIFNTRTKNYNKKQNKYSKIIYDFFKHKMGFKKYIDKWNNKEYFIKK